MHLIGFMGSGKSTVGRLLARRLVWNYLDLDALIVRHVGKPVAAIFADDGEAEFRRQESWVLRQATHKPRCVLALGGGTTVDPDNRKLCERAAVTVWLRCPLELIRERLAAEAAERPLWTGGLQIEDLFVARQPIYGLARHVVDATGSPDEVAAAIEELLLATR